MLRKQVIAAWRPCGNKLSFWERIVSRPRSKYREMGAAQGQMPGREEGRRNSETDKSKTKPVSSWRCQRQPGAMKALPRLVWSWIFLGFGMHLVIAEEQGSQVQQRMSEKDSYQTPQEEIKELTEQMGGGKGSPDLPYSIRYAMPRVA